jgi:hypothetical protein
MKKLFLVLASVALMWSCSSEEEATLMNESSAINNNSMYQRAPTLEDLYADLIISQSYIDHKIATESFVDKMNYTGAYSAIDNKSKMLSWIQININLTDFVNFQDAQNKWADIELLSADIYLENVTFFEAVSMEEPGKVAQVISPSPPETTNDCPVCFKDFQDGMVGLALQFADAIAAANSEGGNIGAACQEEYDAFIVAVILATEAYVACCV